MRKRIAKRVRKNLLRTGAQIKSVEYVSEPEWSRKQCGYCVKTVYNGKECWCLGRDLLAAYRSAAETVKEIKDGILKF